MSKPEPRSKGEAASEGKREAPPVTGHKPAVSGHPEPHPPAHASKPEAKAPAAPIANDLLRAAERAAPTPSATMGSTNVAPKEPQRPEEGSAVGMTPPPEAPAAKSIDPKRRPDDNKKPRPR